MSGSSIDFLVYYCGLIGHNVGKAERTKQMIIEKAASIINEKGLAGTSVEDVLQSAQVAKGCLYGHFNSKEELSHASVDFLLKKLTDKRDDLMKKEKSAKGKLYAFMDMNKDPLDPPVVGGCPILNLSTEADDTNPVVKEKLRTVIRAAGKLFAGILREGIEDGTFSDQLNPEEFSLKMFAAIEGGYMICRVMNSNAPMHIILKNLKSELENF